MEDFSANFSQRLKTIPRRKLLLSKRRNVAASYEHVSLEQNMRLREIETIL